MTGNSHRDVRELLGAYALGTLEPDEETAVRSHLDGCAACRAELDLILPAAQALALADPERVADQPAPPADLGERILAAVEHERRAPRPRNGARRMWAVAAAVLVIGFGAGTAVSQLWQREPEVPLESVPVRIAATEVRAEAALVPHTWGMEIKLAGSGFESGETYRVTVLDEAGREVSAGEFIGTGDAEMLCNLNSSVLRTDASGFEVLDSSGDTVVTSAF